MGTTQRDYSADLVEAARSVMLELVGLLGEYRDDIVLVGGWVPELLFNGNGHIGSTDIDLALNHITIRDEHYHRIEELLLSRDYRKSDKQPFIYYRSVPINGKIYEVEIDFLAGQYNGTESKHRTQRIQEINARKARGCDLAFEMAQEVRINGRLPEGALDSARIRVAGVVPFLVMKAIAFSEREKEKDAYDIYFCLQKYPGGLDTLVEEFRPHKNHGLVREAFEKLAEKFASPEHVGPMFVADFLEIHDLEERAILKRDVYERVNYLLRELSVR